jgi:large subunit ribosomal protein L15
MKLHDLHPAPGSRRPRTRVGRGIAAGKGKTAGRGTKGQLARQNAMPASFEGGQTPLHMRIPKLRGFRNPLRIEFEVVNVGRIAQAIERGRIEAPAAAGKAKPAPVTVNPPVLALAGLVRDPDLPVKVLGTGELERPVFLAVDAISASARAKVEAAGGTIHLLDRFPRIAQRTGAAAGAAGIGSAGPVESAEPAAGGRSGDAAEGPSAATAPAGADETATSADEPAG